MLQVTGQLAGIEARNGGWFAVAIQEEGRQYPTKLSTKRQELVGQAQQLMGQMVSAAYNEQESTNTNPHTGQPYVNRYLEALSLAGQMPQQPQQQQMPQQPEQQQMLRDELLRLLDRQQPQQIMQQPVQQQPAQARQVDRQAEVQRIHRQAACKVAVQLLPQVLQEGEQATLAGLLRISEALVKYFNDGVQWQVPEQQPQTEAQYQTQQQGVEQHSVAAGPSGDHNPGDFAPAHPDMYGDDIPF